MTTNYFLAKDVIFVLNGGLRKTTNQSSGFWITINQITLYFYYSIDMTSKIEYSMSITNIVFPCQRQGENTKIFPLQYVSILNNIFFDVTHILSWLLMTISKKWSTHSGSLLLHISCIWNIYLKDDYSFHNAHKDEDQNIDLPRGQLADNVVILEYALELEQVNTKFLE